MMISFLIVEGLLTVLLFIGTCFTAVNEQRHFFELAIPFIIIFYLFTCNLGLKFELKNAEALSNVMGQPMVFPKRFGEFSQVELGVVE